MSDKKLSELTTGELYTLDANTDLLAYFLEVERRSRVYDELRQAVEDYTDESFFRDRTEEENEESACSFICHVLNLIKKSDG